MLRRSINSLLSNALLCALLPLAIVSAIGAWLKPRRSARTLRRPPQRETGVPRRPIGEFDFHRGVEAYESLIDEIIQDSAA